MAYNLNQAAEDANSGSRFSIYCDGVKSKRLKAWTDAGVKIRILPAFGPDKSQNSYLPFRDAEGQFAPFARLVPIYPDIGHGDFKNRRKLVSAKAHDTSAFCALQELGDYIKMNDQWGYLLVSPGKDAKGYDIPSPFPKRPKYLLIMNVVEVNNQAEGCYVVEAGVSVFNAMNAPQGVLNMVNPSATEEMVQQNHLARWACGDLTDPVHGPVLKVGKDSNSRGYAVSLSVNAQYQVERLDVSGFLQSRVDLDDANFHNVIPPANEAEQIQTLLDTLRGVSPSGRHEWELLKEVFGARHSIPDPAQQPVQANPAQQQQQPTQSLGSSPAAGNNLPGLPAGNIPGAPAQQPAPPAQPSPAVAPAAATAPQPAPVNQVPVAAAPPQPAAQAQQAPQQEQAPQQAPQQEQAPAADRPAVPGQTQQYSTGSFLEQLKNEQSSGS